jgi:hypothetical protein
MCACPWTALRFTEALSLIICLRPHAGCRISPDDKYAIGKRLSAQPLLFDEAYLLQVKTLAIRALLTEGCGLDSCTRQESNTSGAKARRTLDHVRTGMSVTKGTGHVGNTFRCS